MSIYETRAKRLRNERRKNREPKPTVVHRYLRSIEPRSERRNRTIHAMNIKRHRELHPTKPMRMDERQRRY
jgi:hypothetical protein